MKSLLAAIVLDLLIVLAVIAAGQHHGIEVTVAEAIIATYWITIPTIIVGLCVDLFGDK